MLLRHIVGLHLAGIASIASVAASAEKSVATLETADRTTRIAVPAQPIEAALNEFARQSGIHVVIDSRVAGNIVSTPVQGDLKTVEALEKLLEKTGLTYRVLDARTIAVEKVGARTISGQPTQESGLRVAQAESAPAESKSSERGGREPQPRPEELAEIIVTAQKRKERLIDTPQSVSVLSADDLRNLGATQFRDFANTVPGLTFTTTGAGYTQVSLRGVTTGSFDISPTVGIYVDDVPYGSSTGFAGGAQLALDVNLFDIDRIEILRGPQGTLYGASTMGGLIKYVAKTPSAARFGADVQAGVSSTQDGGINYNTAAALNIPLVLDKGAVRVSGFKSHDDGYIDNASLGREDVNSADVYGGRLDLLLTPTDALSVRLNGFAQNISRDGQGSADYTLDGAPLGGELDQLRVHNEPLNQQFRLLSGTIDYDFGPATLTSISSYQTVDTHANYDLTVLYAPFLEFLELGSYSLVGFSDRQATDKFTQEVRLASGGGERIEWLIGGFFTHEASANSQSYILRDLAGQPAPNVLGSTRAPSRYEETAAFADLTYRFTERFDVTGGIRYAENRQSRSTDTTSPTVRSSESVNTYLANARYRFSERATGYVRYATGFRPGGASFTGFNPVSGAPMQHGFESDTLKSYEVGYKAETAGRRFGIDVAAYYIDWNNFQTSGVVDTVGVVINALGGASVRGAELTFIARPSDELTLTGAFAYQNAELSETDESLGGARGERLPNVPRYTAALNADYRIASRRLQPTIGTTVRHVAERTASFDGSLSFPQYRTPAYTIADLRGDFHSRFGEHAAVRPQSLQRAGRAFRAHLLWSIRGSCAVAAAHVRHHGDNAFLMATSERHSIEFDEKKIDGIFSELDRCHAPGIAVGIAVGGRPVYRKGFGLANAELPLVLSPTVRMRIASITKHFTCLAYLLLCEEGRARVDERVGTLLPELHAITHNVTVRQLMGNISGLRDACDLCWQFGDPGHLISSADILLLYQEIGDVHAAPGTAWVYNNGGFLILSAAIERIAGQPLEDVLRQRIFEPLGMYGTVLSRLDTGFIPDSAAAHVAREGGGFDKSSMGLEAAGEGGVISTVDDMLRWLVHMDEPVVGTAATWQAMRTSQTLLNGTSTGYGLGLTMTRYRGVDTVSHAGGWVGGNAQMTKVPAYGIDVVAMANRSDVSSTLLVDKVLDACLPQLSPVEPVSSLCTPEGIFRSPTTGRVIRLATEGERCVASIDGYDLPVVADRQGTLRPVGVMDFVKQAVTPSGSSRKPGAILLNDFGNEDELLLEEPPVRVDASMITGRYRSDTAGIEAQICATHEGARLNARSRFGFAVYELECLAEGIWRTRSQSPRFFGSVLSFDSSCSAFRFWTCRTWALSFKRCE